MKHLCLITALLLSACGSSKVFNPKSGYPPDPWVKGYSNPDDCIGGEKLAAINFDLPDYPSRAYQGGRQGWAIIRLDVNEAGATENVRIERSVPEGPFESVSRKAVQAWTFRPPAEPLSDCRVLLRYRAGKVTLGS